jgi:hypothetical protein
MFGLFAALVSTLPSRWSGTATHDDLSAHRRIFALGSSAPQKDSARNEAEPRQASESVSRIWLHRPIEAARPRDMRARGRTRRRPLVGRAKRALRSGESRNATNDFRFRRAGLHCIGCATLIHFLRRIINSLSRCHIIADYDFVVMDEQNRFLPPIELLVVLAINLAVGAFAYYAFRLWEFICT